MNYRGVEINFIKSKNLWEVVDNKYRYLGLSYFETLEEAKNFVATFIRKPLV